jgi:hypothetical protein
LPTTRLALAMMMLAATAQAIEVVDPADVPPGAVGVCVTEMDGGEVVEIPVEVIGTIGPWAPEGEIVLVRLGGERFRHTGIIAGMSGSPVYVDGRLLGALAFGWPFAKEPIGGVTPFARMVGLSTTSGSDAGAGADRPALADLIDAGGRRHLGELLAGWLLPERDGWTTGLPVAVVGSPAWRPQGGDWLAESWRRLGWMAVPGGAGAPPSAGRIEPGGMVAAVLVDGDAVLAAGGTVTEVRGDEVWAFGHPFLGGGDIRLPMARASVVAVMPSQLSSFKFFSVGEVIGSFEADRSRGIWGRIGETTPLVPVTVTVDDRHNLFRVVRHATLSPFLVAYVVQASQAARGRMLGDQTIGLRIEVSYAGQPPAVYSETLAAGDAPAQAAALTAAVVAYLESSTHPAPDLERVAISLATEERLRSAELLDAIPARRVVHPGDELAVRLRLRPFRGEVMTRDLPIRVPSGMPEGRLDLVVADGASWSVYDLGMRPFEPGSFADEVRLVNSLTPSTSVVLALEARQPGVALTGGSVAMPPGLVMQLESGLGPGIETTSYAVVEKVEQPVGLPLSGAVRIELVVRTERREERSEVP